MEWTLTIRLKIEGGAMYLVFAVIVIVILAMFTFWFYPKLQD